MRDIDEKLHNMMLAHLDGVYVFSARENCDELVTRIIKLALANYKPAHHHPSLILAREEGEKRLTTLKNVTMKEKL